MKAIYKREIKMYFNSMIGYVFIAFFVLITAIYFSIPPVPSHRSYPFRHIYNCGSAEYHNRSEYAESMPFRIYALNSVCHPVSPPHDGISDHPGSGY